MPTHYLILGVSLGSVISSTDAAAIFAVLRSRRVSLKRQLKPLLELVVSPDSQAAGQELVHLKLPHGVLVAMIRRGGEYLVPNGGTELQAGDVVLVLGQKKALEPVRRLLTSPE